MMENINSLMGQLKNYCNNIIYEVLLKKGPFSLLPPNKIPKMRSPQIAGGDILLLPCTVQKLLPAR
jgi:hypothetical protein